MEKAVIEDGQLGLGHRHELPVEKRDALRIGVGIDMTERERRKRPFRRFLIHRLSSS